MKQRFFSSALNPEQGTQVTEEFRNLYKWIASNLETVTTTATTTDATVTDILALPVSEGDVYFIEVYVVAKETDETNRAFYHLEGLFYRNSSGNVTQQGSTTSTTSIESDATWNCTLNADTSSQSIDVRVTGASATINWRCIAQYRKVT